MKLDDIAKNLANRVNQLHYVKWTLDKVAKTAYDKGFKDAQEQVKKLNIDDVSKSVICENYINGFYADYGTDLCENCGERKGKHN